MVSINNASAGIFPLYASPSGLLVVVIAHPAEVV
jgi:hypothetical protein